MSKIKKDIGTALDGLNLFTNREQYLQSAPVYLGTDVEVLVRDDRKGWLWPHEHGMSQHRPERAGDEYDWHADGFAHELCTAPRSCIEEVGRSVAQGLSHLHKMYGSDAQYIAPVMYQVPESVLKTAPQEVRQLGCSPSLNIYEDAGNPSSLPDDRRTTGCHLHLSHPILTKECGLKVAEDLVKWSDILVGNTWIYIAPKSSLRLERKRRLAYGRAGEFRLQTYPVYPKGLLYKDYEKGVEYRVLPGTVITHPSYFSMMFNLYRKALRLAVSLGTPPTEFTNSARIAINEADRDQAELLIEELPWTFESRGLLDSLAKRSFRHVKASTWMSRARSRALHMSETRRTPQPEYSRVGFNGYASPSPFLR